MDKSYDPAAIESRWYPRWESQEAFSPRGEGEPYCIMLPPPNVTGSLHMGHAFQDTIMDLLSRWRRMCGDQVLWQCGTDHAGIATQMVVERQLAAEDISRHDLGRDRFVEKVWEWQAQSSGTIQRQMRRLGASVDWANERFTMDEGLSEAVLEVFVQLYDKGLIYRGKRLVNWDPVLHTALSDLEVESREEQGKLWHLRYPRVDKHGAVIVATTRPETMLGDAAVAVHPDDDRYRDLVGLEVELPLTGRTIPVIADEYVDPEFGTGCVKITPAHDFNDYEVGQRHELPLINVLTADAALNDQAPAAYRGLDRFAARKKIVADLEALGLLERIDEHTMSVPRGDRSGAVLEPFLTDQWYVSAKPLAEPSIAAVKDGRIRFVPQNWDRTYFEWLDNIQDWCISRQLWWGHRIPAWYDDDGNVYVARTETEAREKYSLAEGVKLRQDDDVLDTWFSSALWPFSTLGWPETTKRLQTFYPTNVLVTGFDIIFFWVARMIMMGLEFMGDVPFREVYVHGLIRDGQGQKMSKSKGNVLDPLDVIDGIELEPLVAKRTRGLMQPQMAKKIETATRKEFPRGIPPFGTDAVRFTFAAMATGGRDLRFDLGRVEGYRNFCNKLWNAARFVMMNTDDAAVTEAAEHRTVADRWILARLAHATQVTHKHLSEYRFDLATQALYEFTWDEYCDWYVELAKPALRDASASEQAAATRHTLLTVLDGILRLLHPIIPFITEDIWQRLPNAIRGESPTISLAAFPVVGDYPTDDVAAKEIAWLQKVCIAVRRIRADKNIAPGKPLAIRVKGGGEQDRRLADQFSDAMNALAAIESVNWMSDDDDVPANAVTELAGDLEVVVALEGLIDLDAERARLRKDIEQHEQIASRAGGKLANENFTAKAPQSVVQKERDKLAEAEAAVSRLQAELDRLG